MASKNGHCKNTSRTTISFRIVSPRSSRWRLWHWPSRLLCVNASCSSPVDLVSGGEAKPPDNGQIASCCLKGPEDGLATLRRLFNIHRGAIVGPLCSQVLQARTSNVLGILFCCSRGVTRCTVSQKRNTRIKQLYECFQSSFDVAFRHPDETNVFTEPVTRVKIEPWCVCGKHDPCHRCMDCVHSLLQGNGREGQT